MNDWGKWKYVGRKGKYLVKLGHSFALWQKELFSQRQIWREKEGGLFPLTCLITSIDHTGCCGSVSSSTQGVIKVVLVLAFWGTPILFSIMAILIYILISSIWVLPFLYILTSIYFCLFNNNHSNWDEMICPCGLDLHLPVDLWCWAFLNMPVGYFYVLFWKMSI